jgi:hypothetical protein
MPAFEKKQPDGSQTQPPHDHRNGEKGLLNAAGFEQAEDGLWEKDGIYYGREAAFQEAWRELRNGGSYLY